MLVIVIKRLGENLPVFPAGSGVAFASKGRAKETGARAPAQVGGAPGTKRADQAARRPERGHVYAAKLKGLDSGGGRDLAEGPKENPGRELRQEIDATQQAGVKAVAMDIWSVYRTAVERVLPKPDIVHNKFHLRALSQQGDRHGAQGRAPAVGTFRQTNAQGGRYLWLRNFSGLRAQRSCRQLYRLNLRTSMA